MAKYELFMCYIRQSESTSTFGTNDIINLSCEMMSSIILPYQFSIFDDVGGGGGVGLGDSPGDQYGTK